MTKHAHQLAAANKVCAYVLLKDGVDVGRLNVVQGARDWTATLYPHYSTDHPDVFRAGAPFTSKDLYPSLAIASALGLGLVPFHDEHTESSYLSFQRDWQYALRNYNIRVVQAI